MSTNKITVTEEQARKACEKYHHNTKFSASIPMECIEDMQAALQAFADEVLAPEPADPYAELKKAHAEGKRIQRNPYGDSYPAWDWIDWLNPGWELSPQCYRIHPDDIEKPAPQLAPEPFIHPGSFEPTTPPPFDIAAHAQEKSLGEIAYNFNRGINTPFVELPESYKYLWEQTAQVVAAKATEKERAEVERLTRANEALQRAVAEWKITHKNEVLRHGETKKRAEAAEARGKALEKVAELAAKMPRHTTTAGSNGTLHYYALPAGQVWELDVALTTAGFTGDLDQQQLLFATDEVNTLRQQLAAANTLRPIAEMPEKVPGGFVRFFGFQFPTGLFSALNMDREKADTHFLDIRLPHSEEEKEPETFTSPQVPLEAKEPLSTQVGGSHYKDLAIQPAEFITKNNLGFLEGCIVKRACRHDKKNGAEDIKKLIHEAELILAIRYNKPVTTQP